jgi:diguanylate cyclase (GGDEF)-like protein
MKHTGRVVGVSIGLLQSLAWFLPDFLGTGERSVWAIASLCLYGVIGWWLGRKFDHAKFFSEKDALTQVYNRRFVLQVFPKLEARASRNDEELGVLLLDVDQFKSINDRYGHKKGDQVIRQLSDSLLKTLRKSDILARWGGDEFIILAPDITHTTVSPVTNRIEQVLEKISQELQLDISVSIGEAIYPRDGRDLDTLLKKADEKMYSCKALRKRDK